MLPKDSVSLQAYLVIHPHADLRVICLHGQAEHQGHWCRWYWGCMTLLSVLSLVKVAVHGFVLLKTVSFSVTAALIVTIDFFSVCSTKESSLFTIMCLMFPIAEGYLKTGVQWKPLRHDRLSTEGLQSATLYRGTCPQLAKCPPFLKLSSGSSERASCLIPPEIGNRMWEGSVSPLCPPLK